MFDINEQRSVMDKSFSRFSFTLLYGLKKKIQSIVAQPLHLSCQLSHIHICNRCHFNESIPDRVLLFNSSQLSRCLAQLSSSSLSAATYQCETETASSEQVFLLRSMRSWLVKETLHCCVAKIVSFLHSFSSCFIPCFVHLDFCL